MNPNETQTKPDDGEHKDVRGTTANPFPIGAEAQLFNTLNKHCALHGYHSAEEAVFAWIEQLTNEATKLFCGRSAILARALPAPQPTRPEDRDER